MGTTKIEYAVFEAESGEPHVVTGEDRERAFRLAHAMNRHIPGSAIVMSRRVVISDWEPANTGVVGPRLTEAEQKAMDALGRSKE